MTLQQKMLAKQSKKGFTLVELVVVIAILAILAAIAIPSVIGIINSASNSSGSSNASQLDAACKDFYAGVVSGTINNSNKGGVSANLPAANAAKSTLKNAAKLLTVNEAVQYSGLTGQFDSTKIADYQYSTTDGTITYVGDDGSVDAGNTQLAMNTTFGTLYPNN